MKKLDHLTTADWAKYYGCENCGGQSASSFIYLLQIMLILRPFQKEAIEQYHEQQFLKMLRENIQREYPSYTQVPAIILTRLINIALERARCYGFTWQSSLAQFVYLMAAIAPNFDLHPAVHASLINAGIEAENRIDDMVERLPQGVWDEAIDQRSNIGWFLAQDMFSSEPCARIVSALQLALPVDKQTMNDSTLIATVEKVMRIADSKGWTSEDARFVFIVAYMVFGDRLISDSSSYPWIRDIFDVTSALKTQTALLRIRIALDYQIWV